MADDLGGDALAHLALGLGIDRQGEIGMRLDVDKARRHGEPGRIDHALRGAIDAADCRNPPARNRDVARHAGTAGAVKHSAAADQDIVHGAYSNTAQRDAPLSEKRGGAIRRAAPHERFAPIGFARLRNCHRDIDHVDRACRRDLQDNRFRASGHQGGAPGPPRTSRSLGSVVVLGTQGNPVSNDLDDPDDDGPDLPWRRMAFFAVLGLGLVAVIVYLYVLATGH